MTYKKALATLIEHYAIKKVPMEAIPLEAEHRSIRRALLNAGISGEQVNAVALGVILNNVRNGQKLPKLNPDNW